MSPMCSASRSFAASNARLHRVNLSTRQWCNCYLACLLLSLASAQADAESLTSGKRPLPTPGGDLNASASVAVGNLRCEYLIDPRGIDVVEPRLSWRLAALSPDQRGQRQTGYRILVATRVESLREDRGDLWDSGWVASGQSVNVVYRGAPLHSRQRCFWKVQVRDEAGRASAWSSVASWSMGLLHRRDWTAQWIGAGVEFV
ncbi:MAG: hypothetical protein KDA61_13095, partial [Planctomycetales bacterium]|nr:hypothetical protein [Planctomycetales bacterium]